ncbi:hypothetical protein O6474_24765, partial [Salmonella enterica subsp. enterica]
MAKRSDTPRSVAITPPLFVDASLVAAGLATEACFFCEPCLFCARCVFLFCDFGGWVFFFLAEELLRLTRRLLG